MNLKKIFTREVKVGLTFVTAIIAIIVGINFLKGINVFVPANHYYLKFENIDGLVESNGVFIKGFKVGQVRKISYDFKKDEPFVVDIAINSDIKLPKGTIAYLFDESLLGGKGINIKLANNTNNYISGDTLTSDVELGLMADMADMIPTIKTTISNVDSLLISVNSLVNSDEIKNSLAEFEDITANLKKSTARLDRMMSKEFPSILYDVNLITTDLKVLTGELSKIEYEDIFLSIDSTMTNLQDLSNRINSSEGTIGLLLNDNGLYNNLNTTMSSVNTLLIDLKDNPKRYVHFSVFGKKAE